MEKSEEKQKDFFDILVQNVEKGETYNIRFRDNPVIYTGIPMIDRIEPDMNKFKFKVLSPHKYKGIHEYLISDIESLEKGRETL